MKNKPTIRGGTILRSTNDRSASGACIRIRLVHMRAHFVALSRQKRDRKPNVTMPPQTAHQPVKRMIPRTSCPKNRKENSRRPQTPTKYIQNPCGSRWRDNLIQESRAGCGTHTRQCNPLTSPLGCLFAPKQSQKPKYKQCASNHQARYDHNDIQRLPSKLHRHLTA